VTNWSQGIVSEGSSEWQVGGGPPPQRKGAGGRERREGGRQRESERKRERERLGGRKSGEWQEARQRGIVGRQIRVSAY